MKKSTQYSNLFIECNVALLRRKSEVKWYIYIVPFPCNMLKGTLQSMISRRRNTGDLTNLKKTAGDHSCGSKVECSS